MKDSPPGEEQPVDREQPARPAKVITSPIKQASEAVKGR